MLFTASREIYREVLMTNQIEAFTRFHSFSAFFPILTNFCFACLSNAGPPVRTVLQRKKVLRNASVIPDLQRK